jgi:hypothetical protein
MRVTAVVSVVDPEVPVTVTVYVPAVVPGLPEPLPLLLPPPPQLARPPVKNASRQSMPSMARHLRRRTGMPNSSTQARVAPPAADHGSPILFGCTSAALVGAVVVMVRVAMPGLAPLMLIGLVEPKLNVGGS